MSKPIKWSVGCFSAIVLVLGITIGGLYLLARHNTPEYHTQGAVVKDFGGKQKKAEFFLSQPGGNRCGYILYLSPGAPEDLGYFRERDASFRIQLFDASGMRIKELVILGSELKLENASKNPSLYLSGGFTHGDGSLLPRVARWDVIYEENL